MDRDKYLKALKNKQANEELDPFTQQSLEGYQYLPEDTSPQTILAKLDSKIDRQSGSPQIAIRRKLPLLLSVAATLALLLYAGIGRLNQQTPLSGEDLFLAYHTPLAVALPQQGIERDVQTKQENSELDQAFLHYEKGNYKQANTLFAARQQEAMLTSHVQFYYGLSLLASGDTEAALEQLSPLLGSFSETAYQENLAWYLALAHLERAAYEQARPLLTNLQDSRFYQHKAANLLKAMKN